MTDKTLPKTGGVRLPQIIGDPPKTGPVPIGRSTWYDWVAKGYAPKPIKLGPRVSVWRAEDIHAFLERLNADSGE